MKNFSTVSPVFVIQLKLRSQITTEQEKLLGEKQRDVEAMKRDLDSVRSMLRQKEDECKKLSETVDVTLQKLNESRQLLKTNENGQRTDFPLAAIRCAIPSDAICKNPGFFPIPLSRNVISFLL